MTKFKVGDLIIPQKKENFLEIENAYRSVGMIIKFSSDKSNKLWTILWADDGIKQSIPAHIEYFYEVLK